MSEPSANSPAVDAAATDRGPAPVRARWFGLDRRLVVVLAGAALIVIGALGLWFEQTAVYRALADEDDALRGELELARAELRGQEAAIARLGTEIEQAGAALARRDDEIQRLGEAADGFPVELRAIERRIDELAGGRIDVRDDWQRAQAEYYLVLANTELNLAGRVGHAIEALELADAVLRALGDPGLASVRAAIDDELQALSRVRLPDSERLVLALGNLSDAAAELPLSDQPPDAFGTGAGTGDAAEGAGDAAGDEPSGLSRLWSQTRGAVASIVRVERQDGTVTEFLSEAERRIVRRQLALELQLARVAALQTRTTDFRAALERADAILARDFNPEAQSVTSTRERLAELLPTELEPALPDISDSLRLLRSATGAR